jgi:polar amino acid transport system substrate-binding protein
MKVPFLLARFALFIAVAGMLSGNSEAKAQATTPDGSLAAAPVAPRVNADMLADIVKSGKLRVGVAEIVPWAMHDKDGKLVGFSIDVARKLARDLGVQVEFHPVEFHYLISDLLADRYDIIVSGFSIEPARALLVNFSNPYNSTDVTLAANKKTAGSYTTLQEFNKPTLTIGALEGSTAEEMASKLLPEAQIKTYSSDSALFEDLTKGKLDASAADYPRPEMVAKIFSETISSPDGVKLSTFPSAFAVRRGNADFINFLNAWIASRTADEWLDGRRNYWFKSMDWAKNL